MKLFRRLQQINLPWLQRMCRFQAVEFRKYRVAPRLKNEAVRRRLLGRSLQACRVPDDGEELVGAE